VNFYDFNREKGIEENEVESDLESSMVEKDDN
jgi:hypothetical protein